VTSAVNLVSTGQKYNRNARGARQAPPQPSRPGALDSPLPGFPPSPPAASARARPPRAFRITRLVIQPSRPAIFLWSRTAAPRCAHCQGPRSRPMIRMLRRRLTTGRGSCDLILPPPPRGGHARTRGRGAHCPSVWLACGNQEMGFVTRFNPRQGTSGPVSILDRSGRQRSRLLFPRLLAHRAPPGSFPRASHLFRSFFKIVRPFSLAAPLFTRSSATANFFRVRLFPMRQTRRVVLSMYPRRGLSAPVFSESCPQHQKPQG